MSYFGISLRYFFNRNSLEVAWQRFGSLRWFWDFHVKFSNFIGQKQIEQVIRFLSISFKKPLLLNIGIRRLFSRGGQNFPGGGGQKHTICLKNTKKTYHFARPGGGARAPFALPCGRPCY